MRLPEIVLDDRRFQDLVNEARMRIARSCPEWTEHNVSDPGITLIELFAWMTEMLSYRINRVPEKVHVALLDLLDIQLEPPAAATTDLRFRLAGVATQPIPIEGAETEVGTVRSASEESVVFQTSEDFVVPAVRPVAYVVERDGGMRDVGVADGGAHPQGPDQLAFGTPPAVGDALYLGFDEPIGRLVMQVEVEGSQARGAGVEPEDPPLRWELAAGDDQWDEAEVLEDGTGGFNYGSGTVELQLPARSVATQIGAQRLHWLRCRVTERTRSGKAGAAFSQAPEIYSITAAPVGALIPASHAVRVDNESLGISDGTPGQVFQLAHYPALDLLPGETLEVRAAEGGPWEPWEARESFVESREEDKHFVLDPAVGEISFGPTVRQVDGSWMQYGAIPPKGASLRFARYRYGGGRHGNVAAGTLVVLKSAIPGVISVTNPKPALGGVDPEGLDSARHRASMEIRTRYRAVTAEDFEFLSGEASPRVARALCLPPQNGEATRVHILPQVDPADRPLSFAELTPDEALLREVAGYLDERRVVGTTVQLLPVALRGVSVVVRVEASPLSDLQRVEEDVAYALYTYLNPLVGGSADGPSTGWPFGRTLNQGELYGIVHAIPGVETVKVLRIYETDLQTGEQAPKPVGSVVELAPGEVVASASHIVKAERSEA
jgi:predicted phage baseplate assembly protein